MRYVIIQNPAGANLRHQNFVVSYNFTPNVNAKCRLLKISKDEGGIMAITRWNDPFRGLSTVHRELDDIFSSFLNQSAAPTADNLPTMDVYTEDGKRLVAEVHLPGFSPDDIEIRVANHTLEIRGQREERVEDEDRRHRNYVVRQSVESFFRRIELPDNADTDNIDANFDNGSLRVIIPFTSESQPRRVSIRSASTSENSNTSRSGPTSGQSSSSGTNER